MVKFGKEFRKNQIEKWKDKYLNYKGLKQLIKEFYVNNQKEEQKNREQSIDRTGTTKISKRILNTQTINFKEQIEKNIKTVFILYAKNEKIIYKNINTSLYQKEDYPDLSLKEFVEQFRSLKSTSTQCLDISNFVHLNIKALFKILKKFDKKILVHNNLKEITVNFVQSLLESTNSDLLYLFNFKLVDESCALLEDLNLCLKEEFDAHFENLENENLDGLESFNEQLIDNKNEDGRNSVIKSVVTYIGKMSEQITSDIKEVDKYITKTKQLFKRWENYLMISSEVKNKIYMLTRDSVGEDGQNVSGRDLLYNDQSNNNNNTNDNDKTKDSGFVRGGFDVISASSAISVMFQKKKL